MTAKEIVFRSDFDCELIDSMGSDLGIAQAAWVSTGDDRRETTPEQLNGLLKFLMKNRHGTPFEHGSIKLRMCLPIFLWREIHRHRIGFCLSGDSEILTESIAIGSGRTVRKQRLEHLYNMWHNGTTDIKGRTRHLPSIKNQKFRVLNEDTHLFELARATDIINTGIKETYLIETLDAHYSSLRASKDHRILTVDGWAKVEELSGDEYVYITGKRNKNTDKTIPPSLRAGIGVWTSMQRNKLITQTDKCYVCGVIFDRDELQLDHVVPVSRDLLKALDKNNLKPICLPCHKNKSYDEQSLTREIVAGSKLARLYKKPYKVREEQTYDISIDGPWHNFVADGFVVHNSYNEESGRYKQLEPVFYIPGEERRRHALKPEGFKPSKPGFGGFLACGEEKWATDNAELREFFTKAYRLYEKRLDSGYDNGLARICLPVDIYSACYVTCNARSLMNFLSLRVDSEGSLFRSHPLWELHSVVSSQVESIFANLHPITYSHFVANGRVAP